MRANTRVVTNRVFLLGLDALYRKAMKRHERAELLVWARSVAKALQVRPVNVPVEGYYAEDESLADYFRLVRALQTVTQQEGTSVARQNEFRSLKRVLSSPIFGEPVEGEMLLPMSQDPLTQALNAVPDWTIPALVTCSARIANERGDFSLVGLAARAEDSVVLAALRESVVLYTTRGVLSKLEEPAPAFSWEVDDRLADAAAEFVNTFNALLAEQLPAPVAEQAGLFWEASDEHACLGRCVCLGTGTPSEYYHWAICNPGALVVRDFWDTKLWTTEAYRGLLSLSEPCPDMPPRAPADYGDLGI